MAKVVVIGGGLAGMASAARLAKLGHEVTLLEAGRVLGGAMAPVTQDGFTWQGGPTSLVVPAVMRDLFRKSGRPLEAELKAELKPLEVLREHRFEDKTSVRLPGGSVVAQVAAFDELEPGLGAIWAGYVDSFNEVWETLRRHYFEAPCAPADRPREVAALLNSRETLHKRLRRQFRDERLALVAGHPFVAQGHDLRNVPAWMGLEAYLEQCFGGWEVPGGMGELTAALERRLATRKVTVLLENPARDIVVRAGRGVAVSTAVGEVAADHIVCAIDPRRLPALASYVAASMPAIPPVIAHLGLDGDVPDLPHEVVLHSDPMLVVRTGGVAPAGQHAWTVHGRGKLAEDVLRALTRHGIDVRENIVSRIDLSPRELVEGWGGSPMGVMWQGRATVRHRLGPTTPIPGVYAAGAHATPGSGVHLVGLSASLVAQSIGPA